MSAPKHEAVVVQCHPDGRPDEVTPGVHCPACNKPGRAQPFNSYYVAHLFASDHAKYPFMVKLLDRAKVVEAIR